MNNRKTGTLIGAGIGFVLFLAIALMPSLVYGGYAGLLLAGGIFGTPVEQTLLARGLILFGMGLGVVAIAFLFMLAGAASGAFVQALIRPLAGTTELPAKSVVEHK